jgi:eukaryotic-like serine/threonine-protein kinase
MVGDVLSDRYELEELVGSGGMSSVYRAHDRLLDRKVALKILHQQYTDDAEHVGRFRHEARTVATLSHPNIVTVIDRGEQDGRQFIVLEYVDGENVKELIQRGPVPVATALELGIGVSHGLAFAHQQGLVHRDVKPQNILLNGEGQVKVTDFGIARSLDVQHGMTQTGTVLGTSDYIAPEQAQGQQVDEHTDVYSLGVVMYELLTGEVPFPGENFVAVAMRHINEPPPAIRVRRPDVSPRLEAAVQRAMAKEARDRFSTMSAFRRELEACLAEAQGATQVIAPERRPGRTRGRRRGVSPWPLLLVLAALIAIGAVIAALVWHSGTGVFSIHRSSAGGSGGGTPVQLSAVTAYDPYGSPPGEEHNAEAHFATDGKVSTYWETERYYATFAEIGKPGVGLVLDAKSPVQLHLLGIATATPGFTAVVRAGDSAGAFPYTVSSSQAVSDGTQFTISGGKHRYYLIWITSLPPGGSTVRVNEVKAT